MKRKSEIPFEDSLNDDWGHDLDMVEVPLGARPLIILGALVACIALVVLGRVVYLNWFGPYYAARAEDNADQGAGDASAARHHL